MRKTKFILLTVLTLTLASAAFAQTRTGGRVIEILDGRTVIILTPSESKVTAQLQYIEVPEAEQPFHQIAKDHLQTLVLNKNVEFRARGLNQTRTVGQLLLRGVDVSQQMIRDGAAWYALPEKNAQNADESEIYQSTEAQAKADKLGIWSVENMPTAWQFRAAAEEKRRWNERNATEAAKLSAAATAAAEPAPKKSNTRLSGESQMLAASNTSLKLPANIKMVGGLMIGYEPSIKLGVIATPLLQAEFSDRENKQKLAVQIAYLYYDANEAKGRQSVYLVGVDSTSTDVKFLKYNDLIVTADGQRIVIGKAKRIERRSENGVWESLTYEIKKTVFTKIAVAKKLEIKVGGYSRATNGEIQAMLYNLLQSSM